MKKITQPGIFHASGRFARMAASGVLAASLAAGGLAPAVALAETGSITVNAIEGNTANSYKVFQVFKADVDTANMATHVSWNSAVKSVVLGFLDANGYSGDTGWLASKGYTASGAHDNAQNAAEFISEKIGSSAVAAGTSTTPPTKDAASFATRLARALVAAGLAGDTAEVGRAYTNDEGYYLIVTDPTTISPSQGNTDEAGSAPMWIALGGSVTTITEKSAIPTVDKKVKGAGDASWAKATDAFHLQDVDYQLTATLPSNIKSYTSYHLKFTDTLTGLDMKGSNTGSVKVMVGSKDVTSQLTGSVGSISYADGKLVVDIADVLGLGYAATKDTKIVVTYKAHIVAEPNVDGVADGGKNAVVLTYTNDPVTDPDGVTTEQQTKVFAYKARVVKVDKNNKEPLEGAKFTVQVATYPGDTTLQGKYVQADGSIGASPYKFTSNADGEFTVPGLDAGVYTIAETDAPDGYQKQDADITLTVTSTLDTAQGSLSDLAATLTGGESASVSGNDEHTRVVSVDKTSGQVEVLAADDREFELAETGLEGLTAYLVISGALAAAGIGGIVAVRRHERKQ